MDGLVASDLLLSLLALSLGEVKYLQVIYCIGTQSLHGLEVNIVAHLVESITRVFSGAPAMLHQLDSCLASDVGSSALSSVVHDRDLDIAAIVVPHADGRCHWVVVARHGTLKAEVRHLLVPTSLVDESLLHLKPVRISEELALGIEAVIHLPVHSDVLWRVVGDVDGVDLDVELHEFVEKSWREANVDDSLILFLVLIFAYLLEENRVLVNELALLEDHIVLIEITVWKWIL